MEAFGVLGGAYRVDVDVLSGKVRVRRFVSSVVLSETTHETEFSKLVRRHSLAIASRKPEWRFSNSYGEGLLGVFEGLGHGYYQGALTNCEFLARQIIPSGWVEKEGEVVAAFLELLKKGDDDRSVQRMNEMLDEILDKRREERGATQINDAQSEGPGG